MGGLPVELKAAPERDEYDSFVDEAGAIARQFEDYASQASRIVENARRIQHSADDSADYSRYDFFDHYPNISFPPDYQERYTTRHIMIDALVSLLVQVANDQARADGYDLMDGAYQTLMDALENLTKKPQSG